MIPDTNAYMLAGFIIILGGILVYIISLLIRKKRITHQVELHNLASKTQSEEFVISNKEKHGS